MKNLETMKTAFRSLTDEELQRGKDYVDAGNEFLCGKHAHFFYASGKR